MTFIEANLPLGWYVWSHGSLLREPKSGNCHAYLNHSGQWQEEAQYWPTKEAARKAARLAADQEEPTEPAEKERPEYPRLIESDPLPVGNYVVACDERNGEPMYGFQVSRHDTFERESIGREYGYRLYDCGNPEEWKNNKETLSGNP